MEILFSASCDFNDQDCLVVGKFEGGDYSSTALTPEDIQGLNKISNFKGKKGETLWVANGGSGKYSQMLLVGLGSPREINSQSLQEIGAKIIAAIPNKPFKRVVIDLALEQNLEQQIKKNNNSGALVALGAQLRFWRFDRYKTVKKEECTIEKLVLLTAHPAENKQAFVDLEAIAKGVELTREVVSEPPNILTPVEMANRALELQSLGLKVEILDKQQMQTLGMGALLGVGQGSANESRMVIIKWLNGPADKAPLALVGKGVTFDTGGISIKPSGGMEDMKYDMAGSGVILGLMRTLAMRKAKVNVVGVLAMVENMPSGTAQRPADVVKSMSGQTIEVLNTDAEGRLILSDALWYAQEKFKPQTMINLATLTGAIRVALGEEYAGLFSNNDNLAKSLIRAGQEVKEKLWRLPLDEAYEEDINSEIADMKNIGSGNGAGSIIAAQFLQRFVKKEGVAWAHLDIASVSWKKTNHPLTGKGATAFGLRLLNNFIKETCEG